MLIFQSKRRNKALPIPVSHTIDPKLGEEKFRNLATIGNGLYAKQSLIPNAGNGVFAARKFTRGEFVTEYMGYIIDRAEANKKFQRGQFQYIKTLSTGQLYIEGISKAIEGMGAASLINHACKRDHVEESFIIQFHLWRIQNGRRDMIVCVLRSGSLFVQRETLSKVRSC